MKTLTFKGRVEQMNFIFLLTGILLVFVIGFLVSNDRKKIKYKRILIMLASANHFSLHHDEYEYRS